jgi:hypothetical protein
LTDTDHPTGTAGRGRVLCFATKGQASNDEVRIAELCADHSPVMFAFDHDRKRATMRRLLREIRRERPALVVMEGTGVAGGFAVMLARRLWKVPYVVSTGDAVGPFLALQRPWLGPLARLYEHRLLGGSSAVIGWTPYLTGRAIGFGAPRAATAANWTRFPAPGADRAAVRTRLGIPLAATVYGIVGSMNWNPRVEFCYGAELVRAVRRVRRRDVCVLAVGGGSGLARLRELAGDDLGRRVFLPGAVAQEQVLEHLLAMDVGSLPQSNDEVGALRYTTKISEYLSARLPMVTGQIPLAYDLDRGWIWRLPGARPWDERYVAALAELMESLGQDEIDRHRAAVPPADPIFDGALQRQRVGALLSDVLAEGRS